MPTGSGDSDAGEDPERILLGNGQTLSERVEQVDFDSLDKGSCTTDELRDRLGL